MAFISVLWLLALGSFAPAEAANKPDKQCSLKVPSTVVSHSKTMLIAHRGASFHLPEHTLAAYRLAMELGADYIEPDLVLTKDKHFVAHHAVDLSSTTDVAKVFPNRATFSEFSNQTGYFIHEFTLKEVQKLRVVQRLPAVRSQLYDEQFGIPTLTEILDLLEEWNTKNIPLLYSGQERRVGLYAEIKDPKWFAVDADMDAPLLLFDALKKAPQANVFFEDPQCEALKFDQYLVPPLVVQSFDADALENFEQVWTSDVPDATHVPLILLVGKEDCLEEDWWFHVGEMKGLKGVGPDKACFDDSTLAKDFMERAREHDLVVHVWTERPEQEYVGDAFSSLDAELEYLLCTVGVEGIFTEDIARTAIAVEKGCGDKEDSSQPANCSTKNGSEAKYNEDAAYLAFAAGTMGLLVGTILTIFIMTSRYCKTERQTRRQLRIPTHEDVEMI